jgi:hypothetical protein
MEVFLIILLIRPISINNRHRHALYASIVSGHMESACLSEEKNICTQLLEGLKM